MARYSARDGVGKIEDKPQTSSGDARGANVDVSLGVSGVDSEGSTSTEGSPLAMAPMCVRSPRPYVLLGQVKG